MHGAPAINWEVPTFLWESPSSCWDQKFSFFRLMSWFLRLRPLSEKSSFSLKRPLLLFYRLNPLFEILILRNSDLFDLRLCSPNTNTFPPHMTLFALDKTEVAPIMTVFAKNMTVFDQGLIFIYVKQVMLSFLLGIVSLCLVFLPNAFCSS